VIGPFNNASGGTAVDLAFMIDGTLIGSFSGGTVYGTVSLSTGQVTALTGAQSVPAGGVAVAPMTTFIGINVYPTGAVFSVSSASQGANARLRQFDTSTNTERNIDGTAP